MLVRNVEIEILDIMNKGVGAGYPFTVHECGAELIGLAELIGAEGVTE